MPTFLQLSGITIVATCLGLLWQARLRLVFKLLLSTIAVLAGAVLINSLIHPNTYLGEDDWAIGSAMYASMLLGIVSKYLADLLGETTPRFNLREFLLPIVVSPLVFGSVWMQIKHEISLQTCLLALQNGFFWKTLYDTLASRRRANRGRAAGVPRKH